MTTIGTILQERATKEYTVLVVGIALALSGHLDQVGILAVFGLFLGGAAVGHIADTWGAAQPPSQVTS